jgi:D-alanyl-D-alanine dipeptidase
VKDFIAALEAAGAELDIEATQRPAERAYLMWGCCQIGGYRDHDGVFQYVDPDKIPSHPGVAIDWGHGGDDAAARVAARAMRDKYGIVYPAALDSLHVQGRAIDLTIKWNGTLSIADAEGKIHEIPYADDTPTELVEVGLSYGVHKLAGDPVHWSDNGH